MILNKEMHWCNKYTFITSYILNRFKLHYGLWDHIITCTYIMLHQALLYIWICF